MPAKLIFAFAAVIIFKINVNYAADAVWRFVSADVKLIQTTIHLL